MPPARSLFNSVSADWRAIAAANGKQGKSLRGMKAVKEVREGGSDNLDTPVHQLSESVRKPDSVHTPVT